VVHLHSGPSVLIPDCLLPSPPCGATGTGLFRREPSNSTNGTFTHERNHLHGLLRCETKFFADRFLRDRSICDPIYSFGATFALSPRVRGESRREGTLFRHLKNFVSHPRPSIRRDFAFHRGDETVACEALTQ